MGFNFRYFDLLRIGWVLEMYIFIKFYFLSCGKNI